MANTPNANFPLNVIPPTTREEIATFVSGCLKAYSDGIVTEVDAAVKRGELPKAYGDLVARIIRAAPTNREWKQ